MPYEKLDNEDIQDAISLARQLNAVPPEMRGQSVSAAPTSIPEDLGRWAGQALDRAPDWMKAGADPNKFAEAVTSGLQMLPPFAVEQAMTDTERGQYGSAALNMAGAIPAGKVAAPIIAKAMAVMPKGIGSGLKALADDAIKLSKEEFLAKHSAEVTPEKLERGPLPAQKVHDYVDPGEVDPSEYNMWGDTDLTTGKGGEKVRGMMDTLAAGKEMPPVILRGTPDDPGFRPMVMEGHHRTMAHLLKGEPLPVIYDDKTLGELWDRIHSNRIHKEGGGIAIGQDQVADAIRLARESNADRRLEQEQSAQFLSQNPDILNQLRVKAGQPPLPTVETPAEPNIVTRAYNFVMGIGPDRQPLPAMDVPAFQRPVYDTPVPISTARGPIYQTPRQADAARINNDFWMNRSAIGQLIGGTLEAGKQAFTAPGRAMKGEIPPDQMIPEALNFAGFVTGGAGVVPMEANTLRAGAGFYSKAKYVAENLPAEVMEKQQALGMLKNAGVSPDELKWTNLDVRLSEPGKITKPELVKLIEQNDIKLKTVRLSDDWMNQLDDIEPSPKIYAQFKDRLQRAEEVVEDAQSMVEKIDQYKAQGIYVNDLDYLKTKRFYQDELDKAWKFHNDVVNSMKLAEAKLQGIEIDVPKYENYSLKGGKDYYEEIMQVDRPQYGVFDIETGEDLLGGKRFWNNDDAAKAARDAGINREFRTDIPDNELPYYGPHFDQENIVAHRRGQIFERTDPQTGKKENIYNIDESQSDLGQDARKFGIEQYPGQILDKYLEDLSIALERRGEILDEMKTLNANKHSEGINNYLRTENQVGILADELKRLKNKFTNRYAMDRKDFDVLGDMYNQVGPDGDEFLDEAMGIFKNNEINMKPMVPNAPYIGSTQKWTALNVRRGLIDAFEKDADWFTFTPGAVQAERYGMRQRIETIDYTKVADDKYFVDARRGSHSVDLDKVYYTGKELEDTFGKDIAEQIKQGEGTSNSQDFSKIISVNTQVGGAGHIKYYNEMYANEVKKAFKELGFKVELEPVNVSVVNKNGNLVELPVIGVRLTPEIKAALKARQEKFGGYFSQFANGGKVMPHVEAALRIAARYGDD